MKLLLLMAMSWAEEHGAEALAEHGEIVIPWSNILVQAFNLFLLLGLLTFLMHKAVKKHFAERAQTYRELVDRAATAANEAEEGKRLIKDRLAHLDATAEESVRRANSEAEELRQRLLKEAKALSVKMEHEAQRSTAIELEKAKGELRLELLHKALATSGENLKSSLGSNDQKNLQNEFVQKIEVVGT